MYLCIRIRAKEITALSVPQIDYLLAQIEKWSFFMSICVISQRNHDYTEQIHRLKKIVVQRKNLCTPSYAYLHICIFSKEITALVAQRYENCCAMTFVGDTQLARRKLGKKTHKSGGTSGGGHHLPKT